MDNPYAVQASDGTVVDYEVTRPAYPQRVIADILASTAKAPRRVADIGAGTGKMSTQLVEAAPNLRVYGVEPSRHMLASLVQQELSNPRIVAHAGTSEHTNLPDQSMDLVVWAQSFHWVDPTASGLEARRIMRAGGAAAIVVNQLDVKHPWVHRLTRIMRSGDVCRPHRAPQLEGFVAEPVRSYQWSQALSLEEVLALARTRTSYLRSTTANQTRMQSNLNRYLEQDLGVTSAEKVILPYDTFLWILRMKDAGGRAADRESFAPVRLDSMSGYSGAVDVTGNGA